MTPNPPYAELHCKSNFTFLEGASHPDEYIRQAHQLGYRAIALTDRNTLSGIVRAHTATKDTNIQLIVGAELSFVDGPPLVVWATNRASYGRLSRLITTGRRRAEKGGCRLSSMDLSEHAEGLLAGILVPYDAPVESSPRVFHQLRDTFSAGCYLMAELPLGPDDAQRLEYLRDISSKTGVPLLAAGDVHYHVRGRQPLQDALTAIRLGTTVSEIGKARFANAERHLRTLAEIQRWFHLIPDAVERTLEVADRCQFTLDELRYEYPIELSPPGQTPIEYLTELTWQGAAVRYPQGIPQKVSDQLRHELVLIAELKYEAYFLTVWDLVKFARSRNILCQGRGSAANSSVCFCLDVTSVDPDRADLLFERFVSRERNEVPDIDVDFEHERREEVLQYIYQKYGRDRAGMTAVVTSYRSRSAIRDIGKALGLSLDRVDALAKMVEGYEYEPKLAERCQQVAIDPESAIGVRLNHLVNELIGFPRHLSQHVGGMVITHGPLDELAPIENAAMEGRTVVEWNKDDLDELGILKVDCLSLGMLTAIRKCFQMIELNYGQQFSLANIPEEDAAVYDMICQADTMGVFQIESRAQMSMLPRLKPRCFYDLVIEVAIVRPGPIQGQMVHPYLRRRAGDETVDYPNDAIKNVLHKTLGVPIFQEQAMRLAVVAAGFTPGEADQLRRAMGAWRRPGIIEQFRQKLIDGMLQRGLNSEFAERVFQQIRGFGEYGFPESHAASFALLVYVSAWLKCYYQAAFTASIINSQPMGFYAPAQLIRDCREHGVEIRAIDINFSDWDCTLEDMRPGNSSAKSVTPMGRELEAAKALRLGLRMVDGLREQDGRAIVAARQSGKFHSWVDLEKRSGVVRATLTKLADADVFASLGRDRRQAFWTAFGSPARVTDQPLFGGLADDDEPLVELPQMPLDEQVLADYRSHGLSLKGHPLSFHRARLSELQVMPASELKNVPHNQFARVAGLVLLRQRPSTAKGITFVTLEDETGIANLVLKQGIWNRFYEIVRRSPAWIAEGTLEQKDSVIHLVVNRVQDLVKTLHDRP